MEENIFGQSEQEVATYGKGNGKCPPGHKKSMDAGGRGHFDNDGCGCPPSTTVPPVEPVPIDNIVYPGITLIIMFSILMIKLKLNK